MSYSRCPKCENTSFELSTEVPKKSNFKLTFVRCESCKTVVGVIDYYNIGDRLTSLAKKLGVKLDD